MAFNRKLFYALHPEAKPKRRQARRYLVVGIWNDDDGGRWADSFCTYSPGSAERCAPDGVTVAAVIDMKTCEVVA